MITGTAGPIAINENVEIWKRLSGSHGGRIIMVERFGRNQGLRKVAPHQQLGSLISDVAHFQLGVRGELALDGKRPLLNIGIPRELRNVHSEEAVCRRRHWSRGAER